MHSPTPLPLPSPPSSSPSPPVLLNSPTVNLQKLHFESPLLSPSSWTRRQSTCKSCTLSPPSPPTPLPPPHTPLVLLNSPTINFQKLHFESPLPSHPPPPLPPSTPPPPSSSWTRQQSTSKRCTLSPPSPPRPLKLANNQLPKVALWVGEKELLLYGRVVYFVLLTEWSEG